MKLNSFTAFKENQNAELALELIPQRGFVIRPSFHSSQELLTHSFGHNFIKVTHNDHLIDVHPNSAQDQGDTCRFTGNNLGIVMDCGPDELLILLNKWRSSSYSHFASFSMIFVSFLQDNDISRSKVRYYSNSLQHRVKNRVWQTLLLLLPKLREVR